jgi:DNA polymerase
MSHKQVHNKGDPRSKLWLVGEAPGEDEDRLGEPFVGRAGDILMEVLGNHGLDRKDVYLANVCQFRPYNNVFNNCLNTPELAVSLKELYQSIDTYKPNCIVPLGDWPLHFLADKFKILSWRGSILSIRDNQKIIPTVHPAYVSRNIQYYPIFAHDIERAVKDSQFPELNIPDYTVLINPTDISHLLDKSYNTVDIECTRKEKKIICVGFGHGWTGTVFVPGAALPSRA